MRVKVFHLPCVVQSAECDLIVCFPDGLADEEYHHAHAELTANGSYRGGGGAARSCAHQWRHQDEGNTAKVSPVEIEPNRAGILTALNGFAGHPNNG